MKELNPAKQSKLYGSIHRGMKWAWSKVTGGGAEQAVSVPQADGS